MGERLKDKVAVITGAGRGVGRGIALLMAAEGAKVVVNDVGAAVTGEGEDKAPADQVVDEIRKAGGTAVANYDSVATMAGGESIIRTALDTFGRLDIVCTPAGILRDRMIFNMTEEEWDAVIAVHLKGTFSVVKPASVLFRQQRSGCIITFTSTTGIVGNSGQANYGAAKGGIVGFTRVVARDLGRYGVRVNSIAPSATTRMTLSIPQEAAQLQAQRGIVGTVGMSADLRREPEDVAPFVVWLASDAAKDVNGYVFYVRGGLVSLMSNEEPIRVLHKEGRWTVDELIRVAPLTLMLDVANPAPPIEPRS